MKILILNLKTRSKDLRTMHCAMEALCLLKLLQALGLQCFSHSAVQERTFFNAHLEIIVLMSVGIDHPPSFTR